MRLSNYLKELQKSGNFKQFLKENPGTFFCSAFFVIDKEKDDNKQHLDFYVPGQEKIFSFQMENNIKMSTIELLDKKIPGKIQVKSDIDFGGVEDRILDEMERRKISSKIQKLIFSLQKVGERNFLIGTIFLSMFGLLKVLVDADTGKMTDFEKKSVFDMVNIFRKR